MSNRGRSTTGERAIPEHFPTTPDREAARHLRLVATRYLARREGRAAVDSAIVIWQGTVPPVPVRTPHDVLAQEAADWDARRITPAGFEDAPEAIPNQGGHADCDAASMEVTALVMGDECDRAALVTHLMTCRTCTETLVSIMGDGFERPGDTRPKP